MDFAHSPRAQDLIKRVRAFMHDHIQPVEEALLREQMAAHRGGDWTQWQVSPQVEMLKAQARDAGLWNLFLPDAQHGAGLTHVEYAPLAEEMGKSFLAPEVFNCNAPDTRHLEVCGKVKAERRVVWEEGGR